MNEETLTAVYRNHLGEIISFQTSNGRIISYRKAMQEAEMGLINGTHFAGINDHTLINPNWFNELPNID